MSEESSYFGKPLTIQDFELYLNSLIMISKFEDIFANNRSNKYVVKLFNNPIPNKPHYIVPTNDIGIESMRNLCKKHKIENGGSESSTSLYAHFYLIEN